MANGYMPRSDAAALLWMQAFSDGISLSPPAFMLAPSDAATIAQAVEEYAGTMAVCSHPGTRTVSTIADKDIARYNAEQLISIYYHQIKHNAGIGNGAKVSIGVRPINPARPRITAPSTSPMLDVIAATPGCHTITIHDSMTPSLKAKPFGVTHWQLFMSVSEEPVHSMEGAVLVGTFTRTPEVVTLDVRDNRKTATYWARWMSRRGEVGPWSLPVSAVIWAVGQIKDPRRLRARRDGEAQSATAPGELKKAA